MTKAIASLKQTKAAIVAPGNAVVTLSQAEIIKLAQSIATDYVTSVSARATMALACKKLCDGKVKLGKRKSTKTQKACPVIAAFLDARYPNGLNAKGEKVTDETLANVASYFKRAVETGEPYNENASKTKAKGENIMIALAKSASGAEAAGKLMAGFNKMKEANTELAKLAAFLIDALEDAGFDSAQSAADEEA